MFDYLPYYDVFLSGRIKRSLRSQPTVLHHKTCPDCGRKLVNLYYSNQLERYICKRCMDTHIGENK